MTTDQLLRAMLPPCFIAKSPLTDEGKKRLIVGILVRGICRLPGPYWKN